MAAGGDDGADNSAPLFFLMTLMLCVLTPWAYSVMWHLVNPGRQERERAFPVTAEDGKPVKECQTADMQDKRNRQIQHMTSRTRNCSRGFLVQVVVLSALLLWLAYIVVTLRAVMANSSLYANFDPHAILGVGSGSGKADVKKAFRTMSLKYHPDKNSDPGAADTFMMVKKAFDVLTDPVAKSNFAKYGNPDGPSKVDIGVAIPSISKEYQGLVLILFLFGFILGVPLFFIYLLRGSADAAVDGVTRSTLESLETSLTQNLDLKGAQLLLMSSQESVALTARGEEEATNLSALADAMKLKPGKGGKAPSKAEVLFAAHTRRNTAGLTDSMTAELEQILPVWRGIALAMVDESSKEGRTQAMQAALELHRCLVQALDPAAKMPAAEFLQVPHLTGEICAALRTGARKSMDMGDLLRMPAGDWKALLGPHLGAAELLDVEEFMLSGPRLEVEKAEVFVSGEDYICKDDIATLQVTVVRSNLQDSVAAGSAHAPLFPTADVTDAWRAVLRFPAAKGGYGVRVVRFADRPRTAVIEAKFRVATMGKNRVAVRFISEAYACRDVEHEVTFQARQPENGGGGKQHMAGDDGGSDES